MPIRRGRAYPPQGRSPFRSCPGEGGYASRNRSTAWGAWRTGEGARGARVRGRARSGRRTRVAGAVGAGGPGGGCGWRGRRTRVVRVVGRGSPGRGPTRSTPRASRVFRPSRVAWYAQASLGPAVQQAAGACRTHLSWGVRDGRRSPTRRGPRDRLRSPAVRGPCHGVRGADQTTHHRTAAHHDGSGDVPGAGRRSRPLAGAGDGHRRLSVRRRRERAQHVHRPGHRRADAPHGAASAGHRAGLAARGPGLRRHALGGLDRLVRAAGQSAVGGAVPDGHPLLRLRLHAGAEAAYRAEHRVGRGGRVPPGLHRLVRGAQRAGVGAVRALPRPLLLDAAALLAAVDEGQGRLRAGRRADAAGRGRAIRWWPGRSSSTAGSWC